MKPAIDRSTMRICAFVIMMLAIPFLAGSATPFKAPPDVAHIPLDLTTLRRV